MNTTLLKITAASVLLMPLSVLALDYSDSSDRYRDEASFTTAERAGISVLSNLKVVEGNPNGRFEARRTLNRAEFTKIAMELRDLRDDELTDGSRSCFPDVKPGDWFAPYVCEAKDLGIVKGNPDGLFHPERPVNYAEALKILIETYDLDLGPTDPLALEAWYQTYIRVAVRKKLSLSNVAAADMLTRGQMARLAASFEAHANGELELYRQAERGVDVSSSSSSSSESSASSDSSESSSSVSASPSSSSSSTSSSSSQGSIPSFPARSQFLLLGERSDPIASSQFFPSLEPVLVRGARVKLENENDSIQTMYLVDASGAQLGQLSLDFNDTTNKTWKGTFPEPYYEMPKSQTRTLGVVVVIKPRGSGSSSDELIQVDTFNLSVQGVWTNSNFDSAGQTFAFPKHQTAQGTITSVSNALDAMGAFGAGTNQLLAGFKFMGRSIDPTNVQIEQLEFSVSQASGVTVTNWQLGATDTGTRVTCSVNGTTVSCPTIPAELGALQNGSRTLQLYGSVAFDQNVQSPFLQVSLTQSGTVGTAGAIRWTDGTGHFNWVKLDTPLARSTEWK